jgi:peptidoglycan/LPS O-acetylase OafA/YrhL
MSERIRELDGLRGLAVLGVLAWHFIGGMVDRDAGALQDVLHAATIFGTAIRKPVLGLYVRRTARIWPSISFSSPCVGLLLAGERVGWLQLQGRFR